MIVFVSHSSSDKPFVRRLKDSLQERGITVWLDEAEIRVGESIPEKVAEGIAAAEAFCIVISQASHNSKWVTRELNVFLPRFVQTSGVVLPCRLDGAPLPGLISDVKYADFSTSYEEGLEALFGAIRVKEEVELNADVETAAEEFRTRLNPDEQQFVINGSFRDYLFIGDRRSQRAPYDLLTKLNSIGILDDLTDRYEILYTITPVGERVLSKIGAKQKSPPQRRT